MAITTGQFFSAVLMGITPTALGRALRKKPANLQAWLDALAADTTGANPFSREDPLVVKKFHDLLQMHPEIFTTLLKTLYQQVPVGTPGAQQISALSTSLGNLMVNALNPLGRQSGFLNFDWTNPPHPKDGDVTRMDAHFSQFDETIR
jgi:hypothetical protein